MFSGATPDQQRYWTNLFSEFDILSFDSNAARVAVQIRNDLKKLRKSIDTADLFIAAIAVANKLTLDTLNRKHFEHIQLLDLLERS
ncbi:type II toxin-antitoxin system VapC family toxin [Fibrella rubiginis]|uniref:type II toxin-antitoxin system VapC family toxin n=1 Tax=Fibrella rubiginis TaxID=2817060 RepID=UPI0035B68FC9